MLFIKLHIPSLHKALFYAWLFDEMAGSGKKPVSQDSQILPIIKPSLPSKDQTVLLSTVTTQRARYYYFPRWGNKQREASLPTFAQPWGWTWDLYPDSLGLARFAVATEAPPDGTEVPGGLQRPHGKPGWLQERSERGYVVIPWRRGQKW